MISVICLGYKGYVIKEYFANYALHMSDMTFDMAENTVHFHKQNAEDWRVTLVDTGETTLTGGRLKRVAPYLEGEEDFLFTYGDGLADLDIAATVEFHRQHGRLATVTAVHPPARFGALQLDGDTVQGFIEKPDGEGGFINGGFFVLSAGVLDKIAGDQTSWRTRDRCAPISIAGSGNRWTRCATRTRSKLCGKPERRPGNAGETTQPDDVFASGRASRSRLLAGA